jgi:hypothetical protein
MTADAYISALYREFTDAMTEVLAENAVGLARRGRLARAGRPLKSTLTSPRQDIFSLWKLHLIIGKRYKPVPAEHDAMGRVRGYARDARARYN